MKTVYVVMRNDAHEWSRPVPAPGATTLCRIFDSRDRAERWTTAAAAAELNEWPDGLFHVADGDSDDYYKAIRSSSATKYVHVNWEVQGWIVDETF